MKNFPLISIAILLMACACSFHKKATLVNLDQARIIEIASNEIESKCPTFNLSDYVPEEIYYSCGVDPTNKCGAIRVLYRSTNPIKSTCEATKNLAGPSYRTASVVLSEIGEMQKQDVGEWPEYAEWVYIYLSEYTLINVTHKKDTGEVLQTNRESDAADPFAQRERNE